MKSIKLLLIIATVAVFSGCERVPVASFTTSGPCIAGSTIQLYNTTADGNHFRWTMPDGSTSTDPNPSYTTSVCDNGDLAFTLEAYSRNGKKTDKVSGTVAVQQRTGNITFWTDDPNDVTVTFGGIVHTITVHSTSSPGSCDAYGCANYDDVPYCQTYHFSATEGINQWSGDITISEDCADYCLNLSKAKKIVVSN